MTFGQTHPNVTLLMNHKPPKFSKIPAIFEKVVRPFPIVGG